MTKNKVKSLILKMGLLGSTSLLVACNSGGGSSSNAQSGPICSTIDSQQAYVAKLSAVDLSSDNGLAHARDSLVNYYSNVTVDASVKVGGTVVDCVPFAKQPGLINASNQVKQEALAKGFTHNAQVVIACPAGDVGIVRSPVKVFANKIHDGVLKRGNSGILPYDDGGYMYYQSSASTAVDQSSQGVFVAINSGSDTANIQDIVNSSQHYLQQEWFISGSGSNIASLETGIITSNYFTEDSNCSPEVAQSIFVFSTPNSYSDSTVAGANANQYNLAGGFVQTNDLITFGAPVSNVQYILSYVLESDGNYHLLVSPFTINVDGSYQMGSTTDIGYWPISRYAGYGSDFPYPPNFSSLTSGFEIDVQNGPNIVSTTNSGTIVGYGLTNSFGFVNSFATVNSSTFSGLKMTTNTSYTPDYVSTLFYDNLSNSYPISTLSLAGTFVKN